MNTSDRRAFLEVVVGFAELKGKQLSAPALELFWNSMQGWSIDEFRAAANQLVRTCEFMPTPADFNKLRKAMLPTAGEAWAQVLEHLRTGTYRWDSGPPSWGYAGVEPGGLDPQIDRAVAALGGYRALAMMPVDQLPWMERRFAEHYETMQDVAEARGALPDNVRQRLTDSGFLQIGVPNDDPP